MGIHEKYFFDLSRDTEGTKTKIHTTQENYPQGLGWGMDLGPYIFTCNSFTLLLFTVVEVERGTSVAK